MFDNCEHVLDAAADLVEAILAQSATVKILATSREGLRVADEQLWPVPSLDVGAGIDSAAVTLFVERARSVAPRLLAGETDEADAVVEICRRLDGIPLAIELAASRMVSMTADRGARSSRSPVPAAGRVAARAGTPPDAAPRGAVVLRPARRRRKGAAGSVFGVRRRIRPRKAPARWPDPTTDEYAVLDLLDALVRKSLLVADRSSGRTRFSMLETIRQFAEEQLVAARRRPTRSRAAHARYFAGREADILALWDSPRQREAYDWFAVELANLRAAFRWAADHGDLDTAAAIATYAAFLGFLVENLRADRLGRRAHRARARRRPSRGSRSCT